MKKLFIEISVIVIVSIFASLIFNYSAGSPLPIFKKYTPDEAGRQNKGKDLPEIEIISLDVLEFLTAKERFLLLDARSYKNYETGHIPGSFSFPVGEFEKIFPERGSFLKLAETIIIYCSDENCEDSYNLALKLQSRGFSNIFVYKGGFEEWESSGREIKKGGN